MHYIYLFILYTVASSPESLEENFRKFIFTLAENYFALGEATQLLWVVTHHVSGTFLVDRHVSFKTRLLFATQFSVISLINFMDIKEMVFDHSYDSSTTAKA